MCKNLILNLALFLVLITALAASDKPSSAQSSRHHGCITSVDATARTVTVKKGNTVTTFIVTEATKVEIPNHKADLTDLKGGDEVYVFYIEKRGEKVAIKIELDTSDDGPP